MLKTIVLVSMLTVSAIAQAQTSVAGDSGADPIRERFNQLDRSQDGFLSRDEAKDAEELNTRFTELDRNNDNKLSREEYEVLRAERNAAAGATKRTAPPGAKSQGKPK